VTVDARKGSAAQLFGALRGDVDEQKTARDGDDGLRGLVGDIIAGQT
jgi:hypothetical protein